MPQYSSDSKPTDSIRGLPVMTCIPNPSARVFTTAIVCGWQSSATKNLAFFCRATLKHIAIASAAAVASSSSDAPANGKPTKSLTIV